jgi:subtilase family serine protease
LCAVVVLGSADHLQDASASQGPRVPITQRIDNNSLITLSGNTHPAANLRNDRGVVPDNLPLEHMLLQLRRSPEQERELERYIDQLHDPLSPYFHHWLMPSEFGSRYGLARWDLATIRHWLKSSGFVVNTVYPNRILIDFSGTAGHVRRAFHTELHSLDVDGAQYIGNMTDPRIPARLAPVISGVVSLHNFFPHAMSQASPEHRQFAYEGQPADTFTPTAQGIAPGDLATIFNLRPLFEAGYSGQGQTILFLEETDLYSAGDWEAFRSTFGLAMSHPEGSLTVIHPQPVSGANNCSDPGVQRGWELEAIADVEWATAGAPSAGLVVASCADSSTTFGEFIALQNVLNAGDPPPALVSISVGGGEVYQGATLNAFINSLFQQAVSEGVSVFVGAGDQGAVEDHQTTPSHGIGVNAVASTPYDVAVRGHRFQRYIFGHQQHLLGADKCFRPQFGALLHSRNPLERVLCELTNNTTQWLRYHLRLRWLLQQYRGREVDEPRGGRGSKRLCSGLARHAGSRQRHLQRLSQTDMAGCIRESSRWRPRSAGYLVARGWWHWGILGAWLRSLLL